MPQSYNSFNRSSNGREVIFPAFPIGIDVEDFAHAKRKNPVVQGRGVLRMIGVDLRLGAAPVSRRGLLGLRSLEGFPLDLDADGELIVTDYKTGRVPSEKQEMSRLGGVAVMPQRAMRSTAKASPVRKKAPTFCNERTLSSTTATGIFSIAANSPAEGRFSSSLVILRITYANE